MSWKGYVVCERERGWFCRGGGGLSGYRHLSLDSSPSGSHLQPSLNYRQRQPHLLTELRTDGRAIHRHASTFYTGSRCARRGRGNRASGRCGKARRAAGRTAAAGDDEAAMMGKMMMLIAGRTDGRSWAVRAPVSARLCCRHTPPNPTNTRLALSTLERRSRASAAVHPLTNTAPDVRTSKWRIPLPADFRRACCYRRRVT